MENKLKTFTLTVSGNSGTITPEGGKPIEIDPVQIQALTTTQFLRPLGAFVAIHFYVNDFEALASETEQQQEKKEKDQCTPSNPGTFRSSTSR